MSLFPDVWVVEPIATEPFVQLSNWRAYECAFPNEEDAPTLHLVGFNLVLKEGRVSSALTGFDAKKRLAVTASGRSYQLVGEPGWCLHGQHTFAHWLSMNQARAIRDVTDDLLSTGNGPTRADGLLRIETIIRTEKRNEPDA
jgi:hypothetical protein